MRMIFRTLLGLGFAHGRKRRRTTLRRAGRLVSTLTTCGADASVLVGCGAVIVVPPLPVSGLAGVAASQSIARMPTDATRTARRSRPPRSFMRVFTGNSFPAPLPTELADGLALPRK